MYNHVDSDFKSCDQLYIPIYHRWIIYYKFSTTSIPFIQDKTKSIKINVYDS
jgi:hypothetical protein